MRSNDPQNDPDVWIQRVHPIRDEHDLVMTDDQGVDIVIVQDHDGDEFAIDLQDLHDYEHWLEFGRGKGRKPWHR